MGDHDETRDCVAPPTATHAPEPASGRTPQPGATQDQTPEESAASAELSGVPTIPGYEVAGQIGLGGMGVVYRARQLGLNREVAIKTLPRASAAPAAMARFWAEAEVMAAVKHPNVVQVIELGEHGGRPFIAMEFVPGGSLERRLDGGPLTPLDAARLIEGVARGVAAAHELGVVHRDLKPANVLLATGATPKVADFGVAKRRAHNLTQTRAVMGTPAYMAPEQTAGRAKFVGPQADVWALGVMLYECVCGTKPFEAETVEALFVQITGSEPVPLRTRVRGLPRDLDTIVAKCLMKEPERRYDSAGELADDLGRFLRGDPITARPVGRVERAARWAQRNPAVAGLTASVLLVAFGLVGALYALHQQRVAKDNAVLAQEASERANQYAELAREESVNRLVADLRRVEAEKRAGVAAARAAQANDLVAMLDEMFRTTDPVAEFFGDLLPYLRAPSANETHAATLAPFLRNAATRFRASLMDPDVALVRAKLLASVGNGMRNLGMVAEARGVLEEALALRKANLKESDPDLWRSEVDVGRIEAEAGDFQSATGRYRRVREMQTRAGAPASDVLYTRLYEGIALNNAGLTGAEEVLREVVEGRERALGANHRDTLAAKFALVSWLQGEGRWQEVVTYFGQFREGLKAQPDQRLRNLFELILDCQMKLAIINVGLQPGSLLVSALRTSVTGLKDSINRLEMALPPDHILVLVFRFELAKALLELKESREADELLARIVEGMRKSVGLANPAAFTTISLYSKRLAASGGVAVARALLGEVEAATRTRFGPEHPWLTLLHLERAEFELNSGSTEFALAHGKAAITLLKGGRFHQTPVWLRKHFAVARGFAGSSVKGLQEASRDLYAALYPLVEKVHGPQSERMVTVLTSEARTRYDTRDRAAAADLLKRAAGLLPAVPGLKPNERVNLHFTFGRLELDRGQFAEAERHFLATIEAGKQVPGYAAADRGEDALFLGYALAAQGRFKAALPSFEDARRLTPRQQSDEKGRAWADHLVAAAQLAAGDRDAHAKTVEQMLRQYGKSASLDTLSRLAWSGGLGGKSAGWDPAAFSESYAAAFKTNTNFPWGYRGLALVRLRAGDATGAEAALAKTGKVIRPVDHLLRGLAAVARQDQAEARAQLAKAEQLIEAEKPTEKNPYPYAGRPWHQVTETAVLLAELRGELYPTVAPPPRPR